MNKTVVTGLIIITVFTALFSQGASGPNICFCVKNNAPLLVAPKDGARAWGKVAFGKPVAVVGRAGQWIKVYTMEGQSGYLHEQDVLDKAGFDAQYPHLAVNQSVLDKFAETVKESVGAVQMSVQVQDKRVKAKGESEEVYVLNDAASIYSRPAANSRVVRETSAGEAFRVVYIIRGWYRVEYEENKFGWISEKYARPGVVEYEISADHDWVATKGGAVYIQTAPSATSPALGKTRSSFVYEVLAVKNGWGQVRLDEKRTGWVPTAAFKVVHKAGQKVSASGRAPQTAPAPAPRPAPAPAPAAAPAPAVAPPAPVPEPQPAPAPKPAPKPAPAPAPQPAAPASKTADKPKEIIFVNGQTVIFRAGKSVKDPVLHKAFFGEAYEVERLDNNFCRVFLEDGRQGYTLNKFFSTAETILPVLEARLNRAALPVTAVAVPKGRMILLFNGPSVLFKKTRLLDALDTMFVVDRFGNFSRVFLFGGGVGWVYTPLITVLPRQSKKFRKATLKKESFENTRDGKKLTDDFAREQFAGALDIRRVGDPGKAAVPDQSLVARYQNDFKKLQADVSKFAQEAKASFKTEKAKLVEMGKALRAAKQSRPNPKKMMAQMQKDSAAVLDSLRQVMDLRLTFLADSLAAEKKKYTGQDADPKKAMERLKNEMQSLNTEIKSLKKAAGKRRERAENLNELAKYEFDVDTSARAKDSLLGLAREYDSLAGVKAAALKEASADYKRFSTQGKVDIPGIIAGIEAEEERLPVKRQEMLKGLIVRRKSMEAALAAQRSKIGTLYKENLDKLTLEYQEQDKKVKALAASLSDPRKLLQEKISTLKMVVLEEPVF